MDFYGLIGYPLSHSFSKKYFTEKFGREKITNSAYDLFPIPDISELPALLKKNPSLRGLNVTIPYKQAVIPYLDELDDTTARRIGAVNTIRVFEDGSTKGYNTDYFGFRTSLEEWLDRHGENAAGLKALILGNGGAAKAVTCALEDLQTEYRMVSRSPGEGQLSYADLDEDVMEAHRLIINTTPLGMAPNLDAAPAIPYQFIGNAHFLYDLVYNPETTLFMRKGAEQKAAVLNGLNMLYLQAEGSWKIWNEARMDPV